MNFYHDLITQKSWEELIRLKKTFDFVLIGGWAVYLFAKTLKSKDIDILIDYGRLSDLKKNYEVNKNGRLKKYEARRDEVQIDIYLPHYSDIGIPVEDLISQKISLEGFDVIKKEYLVVLKMITLGKRGRTVKGKKDFLDLLSLLLTDFDSFEINKIVSKYKLENILITFKEFLNESFEAKELNLNRHLYKKLKEKIYKDL